MPQPRIVVGGEGLLVDEGPLVDIPGVPNIPDTVPGRACRLVVILSGISYGGDDIGSTWRIWVTVNGGFWYRHQVSIRWGTRVNVNERVLDETRPGGCGATQVLSFFIRARERDWFLFDDVGEILQLAGLLCSEKPATPVRVIVPVRVSEFPASIWGRLLGRRVPMAILYFDFSATAQCAT
jgi:hypothetical protein